MKDAKARLRRKKVYSFLDVGRLKPEEGVVTVEPEPTTVEGFIRREEQKRQKQLAAQLAAQQKVKDDQRRGENDDRVTAYWSQQPASVLMASPVGVRDDFSGLETGDPVPNAGLDFLTELDQSGVRYTLGFKQRLGKYIESQYKHVGAAIHVPNFHRACARLKSLGCFAVGELTEPIASTAPESEPLSQDAVLATVDTSTREGAAKAKAATYRAWKSELYPLLSQWGQHLRDDYGIVITDADFDYLFAENGTGWFYSRNLPITKDALNSGRRHMSDIGRWNNAVTGREFLEKRLQRGLLDLRTFNIRANQLQQAGKLDRPIRESNGLLDDLLQS